MYGIIDVPGIIRDLLCNNQHVQEYCNEQTKLGIHKVVEHTRSTIPGGVRKYLEGVPQEELPEPWDSLYWDLYAQAMERVVHEAMAGMTKEL